MATKEKKGKENKGKDYIINNDIELTFAPSTFSKNIEMDNIVHEYVEFCIICRERNMPLVKFSDWRYLLKPYCENRAKKK